MFDFIVWLGKGEPPKDLSILSSSLKDLTENISCSKWDISGFNFRIYFMTHDESVERCYFEREGVHIFLLGRTASNKKYHEETQIPPKILRAASVYDLYLKYGPDLIKYTKGNFILCVFDEDASRYYLFNSRFGLLNFYLYKGDRFFLFSSSMDFILNVLDHPPEVDDIAVFQLSLLNYPLEERTAIREISRMPPGSFFVTDLAEHEVKKYDSIEDILQWEPRLNWKETLEEIPFRFNEAVEHGITDLRKFCVSLTGGFDSRAVFSSLIRFDKDILYYSWGREKSRDLHISKKIADLFRLDYFPIVLDKKFTENYDLYARQAVFYADGLATIERGNHTYGYSLLREFSPFFVTGMFGSELLRPSNSWGTVFNPLTKSLLLEPEKRLAVLQKKVGELKGKGLFKRKKLEEREEEFIEKTLGFFRALDAYERPSARIYAFLLMEGFRKYFGGEINMARIFGHVISPFIDDEFVQFLMSTPIPGLNERAFQRDVETLRKGLSLYLPIFKENDPRLVRIRSDRGYAPGALESRFFPFSVFPGAVLSGFQKIIKYSRPYDTVSWCDRVYGLNREIFLLDTDLLEPLEPGAQRKYGRRLFSRHFSLRLWLNRMMSKFS